MSLSGWGVGSRASSQLHSLKEVTWGLGFTNVNGRWDGIGMRNGENWQEVGYYKRRNGNSAGDSEGHPDAPWKGTGNRYGTMIVDMTGENGAGHMIVGNKKRWDNLNS